MASDTTSQRRDGQELAADVDALANQAVLADVEQEAKSHSGKDAADRRLPLIARIYGVLVLLQGVITLPVIVLMAGYSVHEILDGRVTVDVLNLTFILTCAQTVVSSANAACLTVLGVLLIRNRRRYSRLVVVYRHDGDVRRGTAVARIGRVGRESARAVHPDDHTGRARHNP